MKVNISKKTIKLVSIILMIPISLIVLFIGGYLAVTSIASLTANTTGTAVASTYYMDETSSFVANIPYSDYLNYTDTATYGKVYNIASLGASPSKAPHENNDVIQQAIISASENGGGTVLVEGGTFRTTPIKLMDNVTLKIARDSCLENINYNEKKKYGLSNENGNAFIFAENAKNIQIIGPGRLAGNGATYCDVAKDTSAFLPLDTFELKTYILEHRKRIMMGKKNEESRYHMLGINFCENVLIKNIEIYESASWTCRMQDNDTVAFENVIINNNVNVANSDGIDIVGGKNTTIQHCFIATGDDAICPKTEKNSTAVEGLIVDDCEIMSLANCFKLGTDSYNNFTDISVTNCFFFLAGIAGGYAGIALESADGGTVSNVNIDNITMENITSPLLIWLGDRRGKGEIKDISITNITATNIDIACAVTGFDSGKDTLYVKNVKLENFNVSYREANEKIHLFFGGAYEGSANMGGYPEITRVSHMYIINHTLSLYMDIPNYALFARHVDGLNVKNFNVTARSCNSREFTNIGVKNKKYDILNSSID